MKIVVTVKPRSRHTLVEEVDTGHYKVSVTAAPEGGRANAAVLEALADHLGVAKSQLRIVMGKTAREKLIELL